jgi:hypothetical protein
MKIISLFISLTLFTFSFSINLIEISLKINYAIKGILERKELQEHLRKNFIVSDKGLQKTLNEILEDIMHFDQEAWSHFDYKKDPGKNIRPISSLIFYKALQDNEKYINFIVYDYEAVLVAPPITKRKCTRFLFISKCKNVKVEQTITQKEINDYVNKVMHPKIYNRAQLLLPKENNSKFYEIYKKNGPIK